MRPDEGFDVNFDEEGNQPTRLLNLGDSSCASRAMLLSLQVINGSLSCTHIMVRQCAGGFRWWGS